MGTSAYGLPLISGQASVKIPRDFNALSNALDLIMNQEFSTLKESNVYLSNQLILARSEVVPSYRLNDNSISARKLSTSLDADRIKLSHLSDEVLQALAGTTPINATPAVNSVTTEKVADGAIEYQKLSDGTRNAIDEKISGHALVYNYLADVNNIGLWEQGTLNATGDNASSTGTLQPYRIRTKTFLPSAVEKLIAETLYQIIIYRYTLAGVYVDMTGWLSDYGPLDHTAYKYRVIVSLKSNPNAGAVNPTNAKSVYFLSIPDTILPKKVDVASARLGYTSNVVDKSLWEQGHLSATGGNGDTSSSFYGKRIRTKVMLPATIEKLIAKAGYQLYVYVFSQSDVYESNSGWVSSYVINPAKKHRIQLRKSDDSTLTLETYDQVLMLKDSIASTATIQTFQKFLDFGSAPVGWYEGQQTDYTAFNADTLSGTYFSALNTLVAGYSDYVTVTNLGKDATNTLPIYQYDLKPLQDPHTLITDKIPKFLIVGAQHGFEKSSSYGIYYFIKDLLENWDKNPILEYLRFNVRIITIPIANPYGFDNKIYKNGQGVNLNRNYDCPQWTLFADPTSEYYGGPSPFSEIETQYIKNMIDAHPDALYLCDYHTNGQGSVDAYSKINWHSIISVGNDYYNKLFYASRYHIRNITSRFKKQYNLPFTNQLCGYIDAGNTTPSVDKYAAARNVMSTTFEGFNGFPSQAAYTPDAKKANAELFGNWLMTVINQYK